MGIEFCIPEDTLKFDLRTNMWHEIPVSYVFCRFEEYAIPKINMLHDLSCLETRCAVDDLLHSSLNLVFKQHKLHNIFIFGMGDRKYIWTFHNEILSV